MIDTGPFHAFRILRQIDVKTVGDPNRDQRSILSSERRFYSPPLRSENGAAKPNREAFLQLGHFEDYKYGTVHWNSYRVGRSKRGSNGWIRPHRDRPHSGLVPSAILTCRCQTETFQAIWKHMCLRGNSRDLRQSRQFSRKPSAATYPASGRSNRGSGIGSALYKAAVVYLITSSSEAIFWDSTLPTFDQRCNEWMEMWGHGRIAPVIPRDHQLDVHVTLCTEEKVFGRNRRRRQRSGLLV
uniref:Uncharacterized protein n=1 Tax=Haemonchus contortus TaxID=6289 RepID=A0A7I5EDB6_HAECO